MAAFNQDGKVVNVNDRVSITGQVVSVTGASSIAQVTVRPNLSASTFVAQANDMQAVAHQADAAHPARSISGQPFGFVNNAVTVLGVVTGISGTGNTATLTVLLKTSQTSITVPAGAVRSVADVS